MNKAILDLGSRRWPIVLLSLFVVMAFLAACSQPTAPVPTSAPASAPSSAPAAAATKAPAPASTAPTSAPTAAKVDFPANKPITMIVGATAGGGMDAAARTLAPYLEKALGTKVVLVNKPAAGGQASLSELAKTKPDGYTVAMISVPAHNSLWLDPARKPDFKGSDLLPIANHVWDPGTIVVRTDSPWKTISDFVKAGKENPGKLSVTFGATGNDDHFHVMDIMDKSGADFLCAPTQAGHGAAVTQFLGGHVDALACNESEAIPLVKNGDARMLALSHSKRSKYSPDVPTMKELGLDVMSYSLRGYVAPKGISKPIMDILERGFKAAITDPEQVEKLEKMGSPVEYLGSEEYAKIIITEDEKVSRLAKKFNLFEAIPQN